MTLRRIVFQVLLLGALILAAVVATEPNSSCNRTCGSVSIPYPFGTSEGCHLDRYFLITCNHTLKPPKPFLGTGNIEVLNISRDGELRILNFVQQINIPDSLLNKSLFFPLSNTKNKLFVVGCNTVGYIEGTTTKKKFKIGCLSYCDRIDDVVNGSCYGLGCCQSSIPENIFNFSVASYTLNDSDAPSFSTYSFAFVAEKEAYKFSSSDFVKFREKRLKKIWDIPLVVDWMVRDISCQEAQKNHTNYACKAANSECHNYTDGLGYRCHCSKGYDGNPYLHGGCKDIDECKQSNRCRGGKQCINLIGTFRCLCPKGYKEYRGGNETMCIRSNSRSFAIVLGLRTSFVLLVLLVSGWFSYKILKKRRRIKQKKKFFKRNGGLLLQQKLFSHETNVENSKLFTSKDLEKATDHFNMNRILGQGGQGTVYKGMLVDGRIVAVKKSKIIDEGRLQEFINEVVILSQINHRNVVKLIGCCLETEVPLLVYEYVPNGTLAKYLGNQSEEFLLTWDMRLRIAIEVAGALYYLHSVASSPIFHRDIKSTNILLDDKYRAKIADFGTSRSIMIDQTHLTTLVYGTFGYLDPEYFQSSQFTEKSDVYSFGVVLAELLTGEKVISSTRIEKSLAIYFIESIEENKLFDILDSQVLKDDKKEEKIVIANLTKRCLNLNGKMRPSMKEVAMELEAIQISRKGLKTHEAHETHEELEHVKTKMDKPWDVANITTFGIDDGTNSSTSTYPLLFSSG